MIGQPLIRDTIDPDRMRVVETYGGAVLNLPGAKEIMESMGPELQAVVYEGWKLIEGGGDVELYYLPDDPDELNNLAETDRDRVAQLREVIASWANSIESGTAEEAELDEEDVEALRSLGYVE